MNIEVEKDGLLRFIRGNHGPILAAGDIELHKIGYDCDTCGGMFEQVGDYKTPLTPEEISRRFSEPMLALDRDVVDSIKVLLPAGSYNVGLLRILPSVHQTLGRTTQDALPDVREYQFIGRKLTIERPHLYKLLTENEQGEDVKINCFDWRPHFESEVILPHRDLASIDWKRVHEYERIDNDSHTALVLSLGEARGGECTLARLTHFLLDGHHKLWAAVERQRPIQLLSFFNMSESRLPLDRFMVRHPAEFSEQRLTIQDSRRLWCEWQVLLHEEEQKALYS
jgi:hypothetical protein